LPGLRGREHEELLFRGYRVSGLQDEKVLDVSYAGTYM
jgi:hypothetical protein